MESATIFVKLSRARLPLAADRRNPRAAMTAMLHICSGVGQWISCHLLLA